jgi:iron complex outermembrane receptor protein
MTKESVCRTSSRFALAAALACAGMATPAAAWQEEPEQTPAAADAQSPEVAESDDNAGVEEIVVRAQFRDQNLQDTPIAITAVNAAMLEARSQTNLTQIGDQAPNVQIKPQGGTFGPSISASIRGVGQGDFNPAYEPGVGIYIDDVYYPQLTGAVFDLLDLERVEILRGPQGTLAGRNSIGGAIKMYSRKPDGSAGGYVEGSYGSRDRIGLRASVDFPITDTLFGRVSGVFKQQDGYVDRYDFGCVYPVGSPENPAPGIPAVRASGKCKYDSAFGEVGYQALRGILRWAPVDNFEATIIADYTHDERTPAGEVLLQANLNNPNTNPAPNIPFDGRFICGKFCNFATTQQPAAAWVNFLGLPTPPFPPTGYPLLATSFENKTRYDGWGVSGQVQYDLNDSFSIESITGYREFNSTFNTDDDISPALVNFGQNELDHWSFSQELRLNGEIGETFDFTLGGYYFEQSTGYWSYQDIRYVPVFPLQFIQPDVTDADSKAAFAHASWEAIPNLTFSGGVRYTEEAKTYNYFRLNPDGTVNPFLDPVGAVYGPGYNGPDTFGIFGPAGATVTALTGSQNKYKGDRIDWRVSVDYRFSPEFLAYATVATGFKGGGTNPRPFNINQVISFNPEVLTAYEVGFKSDLFGRTLRLNVSAFYNEYNDIQLPVLACPDSPCAALLNAGDGEYKGFEGELFWRPIRGAQVDASLSYLDFKFTSLNPLSAYPTNPAGSALDDPSPAPKWKWSFGAQYEIPMGDLGSLTPRIDAAYQDKLYTGPVVVGGVRTRTFIPSYTIANARLTWRNPDDDLQVSLEVTNLFDKYYFLNVLDFTGIGAGFKKGQPGRPREWALTVSKKF